MPQASCLTLPPISLCASSPCPSVRPCKSWRTLLGLTCDGLSLPQVPGLRTWTSLQAVLPSTHPHAQAFSSGFPFSSVQDVTPASLSENLGHGDFKYMSAVCWLFGRYLYDTLQYPVGLIASSWAGTPIEAWSSERSLKACGVPRFIPSDFETGPSENSVLWNAMVHPLHNMTLKGVIWYQGESNINFNRDLYNCTFPALIEDWRQTFHRGSQGQTERFFPFGFVQLSSFLSGATSSDGLPHIRWHQTADFGYVPNLRMPNTFMAVAMDLCDRNSPFGSAHPRDKQTVAYRLHLGARAVAYGEKLTFQGPLPQKMELLADRGLLNLTYSQQILVQRQDKKIFEVSCCSDQQCKWLPAPMDTFSTQTLALDITSCQDTLVAVRYAWSTWPCEYKQCPLYHPTSTLPAPPFTAFITNQIPDDLSKGANDFNAL
ncbi:sialate O-acetylesterase isoform X3 [Phacochoerus africanus]|uniref:sialate O-acetylesterase isoform X3 n=1 Tax=Phacochoerus africanus TaxID=41426 RepID=UPI001FD88D81|nr:sialate O-acetylesterase isoform X3 [Phacochoerus africanus]XP_047608124.1 sialate O-acetylesterase isoform X3 [Phacochoerus africanus]XP_047608125.1 sialate O-acetylesterase isoform X3 [Phacochoerus africanus]XP_047608127.1 sialate O-acetylesterase isoform X3 [Phacochoerus africanus]XP_047608128.1 sialate O-acetylesterase isoform X3 [Phacochoerus africanus]